CSADLSRRDHICSCRDTPYNDLIFWPSRHTCRPHPTEYLRRHLVLTTTHNDQPERSVLTCPYFLTRHAAFHNDNRAAGEQPVCSKSGSTPDQPARRRHILLKSFLV